MKRKLLKSFCFILFSAVSLLIFSERLSVRTVERYFMTEEQREKDAHENPFFWQDAMPMEGYNGLYELTPFYFRGKAYNRLEKFGDNILLIGESYPTAKGDSGDMPYDGDNVHTPSEQEGISGDMDYDGDIGFALDYSFAIYDPWNNRITAAIGMGQYSGVSYQVVGDYLILTDYARNRFTVMDTGLRVIVRTTMDEIEKKCSGAFYGQEGYPYVYTYDYNNNIYRMDFTKKDFEPVAMDLPYYQTYLHGVTDSGTKLLFSGVDKKTLKNVTAFYDTEDGSISGDFTDTDYFSGTIEEEGALYCSDFNRRSWTCRTDQGSRFFTLGTELTTPFLLADGKLLVLTMAGIGTGEENTCTFTCYDETGKAVSSFSLSLGTSDSPNQRYIDSPGVFLEECDCVFFLLYDQNGNPSFLIWDLKKESAKLPDLCFYPSGEQRDEAYSGEPLNWNDPQDEPEEIVVNSWGELESVNDYATELENKYGISIYLGEEVPERITVFYTAMETDPLLIHMALQKLDKFLADYPSNFWQQLCYGELEGIKVYLSGGISNAEEGYISDAGAFVNTTAKHQVMVLNVNYNWNWEYTLNHEISHLIDRRLALYSILAEDSSFSEENWAKFNPEDFRYRDSYVDYVDNPEYTSNRRYFIDSYGTTFSTEDRAEIFGTAVSNWRNGNWDVYPFEEGNPIYQKLEYYSKCIREGFDSENWPEVLPWEQVLKRD